MLLKYIISLISIPLIFSQNACDNCINNLRYNNNIDCTDICNDQTTHLIDCTDYTRCLYDYNLHKIGEVCICQKPTCNYEHVCPYTRVIEYKNNNLRGYTTYEVSLEVKDLNSNIYAIYGTSTNIMSIPPAYQMQEYQGANIGGINPLLINYMPDSRYDSWLTIGLTDGDPIGQVDAIGIDFSSWNENNPLIINDGAIFLDDPLQQISQKKYIIAHLTLKNNIEHQMIINVNGRINVNEDQSNINNNNINSHVFSETGIEINFPIVNHNV